MEASILLANVPPTPFCWREGPLRVAILACVVASSTAVAGAIHPTFREFDKCLATSQVNLIFGMQGESWKPGEDLTYPPPNLPNRRYCCWQGLGRAPGYCVLSFVPLVRHVSVPPCSMNTHTPTHTPDLQREGEKTRQKTNNKAMKGHVTDRHRKPGLPPSLMRWLRDRKSSAH